MEAGTLLCHIMTLFQAPGLCGEVTCFPDWMNGRKTQHLLLLTPHLSLLLTPLQFALLFPLSSK